MLLSLSFVRLSHILLHLPYLYIPSIFFIMSLSAKDASGNLVVPSSGVGESSQIADANATTNTLATDVKIGHKDPSWSIAEYMTRYANTLDARRFGTIFSDSTNFFFLSSERASGHKHRCFELKMDALAEVVSLNAESGARVRRTDHSPYGRT